MIDDLRRLYGKCERGHLGATTFVNKTPRTEWFCVSDLDFLADHMAERSKTHQCYHTVNLVNDVPSSGRGKRSDFSASTQVLLDVDLRQLDSDVHANNDHLPETWDEVSELLAAHDLPFPTSLIDSGNGLYARYVHSEPWFFEDEVSRLDYERLVRSFYGAYASAFKSKGWNLDNVSDLPRITRSPGTWNHKTDPAKPVRLVNWNEDLRLSPEVFREIAGRAPERSRALPVALPSSAKHSDSPAVGGKQRSEFRSVLAACRWLQDLASGADHMDYDNWFALAGVLKHCEDGEEIFHKISQAD